MKEAAGDGLDAHDFAKATADLRDGDVEGYAAELDAVCKGLVDNSSLEAVHLRCEVRVVVAAKAWDGAVLIVEVRTDGDDAVGIVIAERAQKDVIDHAEDGAVDADADGQRNDDGKGEGGRFAEAAEDLFENGGHAWSPDEVTVEGL